jgi:hypothetical protein
MLFSGEKLNCVKSGQNRPSHDGKFNVTREATAS